MAAQLKGAVGRFKKLKILYFIFCLSLQFISDVSATNSIPVHIKDSIHIMPNKSMQKNSGSEEKILARKSRETLEVESASMYSEDGNESETMSKGPYSRDETSESASEQMTEDLNNVKKRSKDASLIPYPRIGRTKVDPNLIMPYPDSWLIPYLPKTQNELNEINASDFNVEEELENSEYFSEESDNENSIIEEEVLSQDNDEYQFDSITERQVDSNGTVIPYPRLGKRDANLSEKDSLRVNKNPSTRVKRTTDSMIPQMRYGRSTQLNKLPKPNKQPLYILPNYRPGRSSNDVEKSLKYSKSTKPGILPYPRPGRSNGENIKRQTYILPQPRFGRSLVESKAMEKMDMFLKSNPSKHDKSMEELLKSSGESQLFLIPYPRPGKRFFGTKPLPPNVNLQVKDKEYVSYEDTGDKEQAVATFLVPYPRPGRSGNSQQYFIPNARFSKATSESMLPLFRYGRSSSKNNILPYPRPGRSETLIPQARFGRSNILPYPRPGRSSPSILPYPRPGRSSSSVLPYPRLSGTASFTSIIPQMRVGKSSSSGFVIPQMRVGKSSSSGFVIPQMRVGKSSSSGFIIPQMRVGKSSGFVFPQMRVGKSSGFVIPQMRVGKAVSSGTIIPQMRVGKSSSSLPLLEVYMDEDNDLLQHGMQEVNDLDHSEDQVQQLQKSNDEPSNFQTNAKTNIHKSTVLIPAKKLQKHMLSVESNYMLPYPRPGRTV